ncbi:predicted protein [Histoplasma capsulatum H143]|uniref:Uncharacterized protein n=1 Tax=Ajellomyces capsulatus (strain H143) TaxID=544712 RepID=C6HC46_AJECH|nr:predicted protein [Histoplasma capsulatum H143]
MSKKQTSRVCKIRIAIRFKTQSDRIAKLRASSVDGPKNFPIRDYLLPPFYDALGHRISEKSQHLCYALASSLPFNFATTCASLVVHERPSLSSLSSLQRTGFQGLSLSIGGNDCWNWKHRAGLSHGEQRVGPERASCFLVVFGIFLGISRDVSIEFSADSA